ncbi:MAG TPA: hypothetical protein GX702_10390 [Chloroflexi bacterium]|jgi:hypothetical protein|nr:hypothetical protein [Chloroflexota bacterium]
MSWRRIILWGCMLGVLLGCGLPGVDRPVRADAGTPLPLSAYPRPLRDNGWGIHWVPTTFSQPDHVVDYYVDELVRLNIRWVKLLVPPDPYSVAHRHLLERLRDEGIMPIVRIYVRYNEPVPELERIVRQYVPLGARYFEVYTDVNLEGIAGGWENGEEISIPRIVDLWADAARAIRRAGGYPGLPTLTAGGHQDDLVFLRAMLRAIKSRGYEGLLNGAWLPVHNTFFNHPVDYPYDTVNMTGAPVSAEEIARWQLSPDEVNAMNEARRRGREKQMAEGYFDGDPLDVDSNGFLKYRAYRRALVEILGYEIPILSTAGGAVFGSREDARYPTVTHRDVAETTLYAYHHMLDDAPDCYFVFAAWMLANEAGGGFWNPSFERAAWYTDLGGGRRSVVDAVAGSPRRGDVRTTGAETAATVTADRPVTLPTPTEPAQRTVTTPASLARATESITPIIPISAVTPDASGGMTTPSPIATPRVDTVNSPYALFADGHMTMSWQRDEERLRLQLAASQPLEGELQVWHRGRGLARWAIYVRPDDPLALMLEGEGLGAGSLGVRVTDQQGDLVVEYGCVGEMCR